MGNRYLAHHGILGQKWGVRRFQNKDGSYTAAGKKRYSVKDVEDAFDSSINSNKDIYERVKAVGSTIPQEADKLMSDYEKAYKSASLDSEAKNRIIKNIETELGVGCDDPELWDLVVQDYVEDELKKKVDSQLGDKRQKFDKLLDNYWDDVQTITDDILKKYGDKEIAKTSGRVESGSWIVNDMIGKKLDTSINSYITRHFDDYWVYNDEYYNALERIGKEFSMSDYNKAQKEKRS